MRFATKEVCYSVPQHLITQKKDKLLPSQVENLNTDLDHSFHSEKVKHTEKTVFNVANQPFKKENKPRSLPDYQEIQQVTLVFTDE